MSDKWKKLTQVFVLVSLAFPLLLAAEKQPELQIRILVTPSVGGAELRAEVTGGEAPYHYRWSRRLTTAAGHWSQEALDIGGDSPKVYVPLKEPFERSWIWCEVTDAKGLTAKHFRRVLPLPPGEKEGGFAFFGIGDSVENAGKGAHTDGTE